MKKLLLNLLVTILTVATGVFFLTSCVEMIDSSTSDNSQTEVGSDYTIEDVWNKD